MKPYNDLDSHLKQEFGGKVYKVCLDAGFTCPNRDGVCGTGGCSFCGCRDDRPLRPLAVQMEEGFRRAKKKYHTERCIAYFQDFTNTYAPLPVLQHCYDTALTDKRFVALAVGTRPDCVSEAVATLLASYQPQVNAWVELGLQTADDKTARAFGRGYDREVFSRAVTLLRAQNIDVVVHLIVGLPGEDEATLMRSIDFVNAHDVQGVKLHSLCVMRNTQLAAQYLAGDYQPLTMDHYVELAKHALCRLRPDLVIHRLTGDCPRQELLAPAWVLEKSRTLMYIEREMCADGLTQGCQQNAPIYIDK